MGTPAADRWGFHNPASIPFDSISAQDRINEMGSTLSPQERAVLEASILLASGGTLATTSFHEFMHWWAMCGYSYQGWLDLFITWKFRKGQSTFARRFFDEAVASKRLSYAFDTPVQHVKDTGSGVEITSKDGQRFRALRVICAVPLNVLGSVSFDPPLSAGKQAAISIGHVNQTVKVHAELSNKNLRSWTGITYPHNELHYAIGDGTTPTGNTHVVCFGGQNKHMDPEADISRTKRAVSSLFSPSTTAGRTCRSSVWYSTIGRKTSLPRERGSSHHLSCSEIILMICVRDMEMWCLRTRIGRLGGGVLSMVRLRRGRGRRWR